MAEYKILLQRVGLIGVTQLLVSLSGIILLPILTKNLPIEEYGMWTQVMVTVGLFPGLAMLGLPYTMVRFLPSFKNLEDIQETFYSIFSLCVVTSGIISSLIYIFSRIIASALFDNNIFLVKVLSLIVFLECLNNLCINYLRARQRIKKYSLVILLRTLFQISIVSFLVLMGKGIFGAITGLLITNFILFLFTLYLIISEIGTLRPKFKNIKKYLDFGIPTVPGNFSSWIVDSSDRYVIGILLGTASVGYYSPGYALGTLVGMFFAPSSLLFTATLSKYYDEYNMEEVIKILGLSLKYLMAISIPATFGIAFLSKPILTILSTQEIASQGYLITPFVALSTLLLGISGVISEILSLEKKTTISGKIWIIASILNLSLNFVLIPYIGILGAAITTLIAFTVVLILITYYSFKLFKFDIDLTFILKSTVSSVLMSTIIIVLSPEGLSNVLYTIGICILVYILVLFLLKGLNKQDLKFLRQLINN
jgi:O-antigen/teichoic acid export membrane protein